VRFSQTQKLLKKFTDNNGELSNDDDDAAEGEIRDGLGYVRYANGSINVLKLNIPGGNRDAVRTFVEGRLLSYFCDVKYFMKIVESLILNVFLRFCNS